VNAGKENMDSNNPKLQELVALYKQDGHSDEEVASLLEEVTKAVSAKFQAEMIANLSDEDMKEIDKCTSQEEANFEIRTRFSQKSGKNPDDILSQMLTDFSTEFMEKYKSEKPTGSS
jgi:hypothetical protein